LRPDVWALFTGLPSGASPRKFVYARDAFIADSFPTGQLLAIVRERRRNAPWVISATDAPREGEKDKAN
jgi:hypothetical protein